MAKKKSFSPFVLLSGLDDGGDVTVIGGGTGQSTTDVFACSFEDWLTLFATDMDGDGDTDRDDYKAWFEKYIDDDDLWALFNPDDAGPADEPTFVVEPETVDPVAEMLEPEI